MSSQKTPQNDTAHQLRVTAVLEVIRGLRRLGVDLVVSDRDLDLNMQCRRCVKQSCVCEPTYHLRTVPALSEQQAGPNATRRAEGEPGPSNWTNLIESTQLAAGDGTDRNRRGPLEFGSTGITFYEVDSRFRRPQRAAEFRVNDNQLTEHVRPRYTQFSARDLEQGAPDATTESDVGETGSVTTLPMTSDHASQTSDENEYRSDLSLHGGQGQEQASFNLTSGSAILEYAYEDHLEREQNLTQWETRLYHEERRLRALQEEVGAYPQQMMQLWQELQEREQAVTRREEEISGRENVLLERQQHMHDWARELVQSGRALFQFDRNSGRLHQHASPLLPHDYGADDEASSSFSAEQQGLSSGCSGVHVHNSLAFQRSGEVYDVQAHNHTRREDPVAEEDMDSVAIPDASNEVFHVGEEDGWEYL